MSATAHHSLPPSEVMLFTSAQGRENKKASGLRARRNGAAHYMKRQDQQKTHERAVCSAGERPVKHPEARRHEKSAHDAHSLHSSHLYETV